MQLPNPNFNIYDDTPEEPEVYDSLRTSHSNIGIFQLGQRQAAHLCHLYDRISSLTDISAVSALLRPGMSDIKDSNGKPITERYIARHNGQLPVEYRHPALEPVLKDTQGELLFQESAIFTARYVAGFDLQKADLLRVAIGKKNVEKMKSMRADFVKGCQETSGIDEDTANKIFDDISAAGRYSFNRCVSGKERLFSNGRNRFSAYHPTIAEMYRIKNDREYAKTNGHEQLGKKYRLFGYTGSYSVLEDRAKPNKVVDIRYAGFRTTYKITIEDGRTITVTSNHKFPTPKGEKIAGKLKVGDKIYAWDDRTKKGKTGYKITEYAIARIEKQPKEHVYDVEMSGDVSHTFLIENGIVTCNSHAASYAKNAYIDLYFRYHFPELFYAAQLAYAVEKGSPKEKTTELVSVLIKAAWQQSNIDVYPPSLIDRYIYTSPVTAGASKHVRLGFRHVIGFGSPDNIQKVFDAIDKITSNLGHRSIANAVWTEILCCYSKKIGKTMMESLIKIGCFGWANNNDNRRGLLHEYRLFLKLSDSEVKWITTNCLTRGLGLTNIPSLQQCVRAMLGTSAVRSTRVDNVKVILGELLNTPTNTSSLWKRMSERSLLYCPFSSPITDQYAGKATAYLDRKHSTKSDETFVLYIEDVTLGKQKDDLPYARLKCIDELDNSGTVMVFGKEYPRYQHLLQQGEVIQVNGKVQVNEFGTSVIASSVH